MKFFKTQNLGGTNEDQSAYVSQAGAEPSKEPSKTSKKTQEKTREEIELADVDNFSEDGCCPVIDLNAFGEGSTFKQPDSSQKVWVNEMGHRLVFNQYFNFWQIISDAKSTMGTGQ